MSNATLKKAIAWILIVSGVLLFAGGMYGVFQDESDPTENAFVLFLGIAIAVIGTFLYPTNGIDKWAKVSTAFTTCCGLILIQISKNHLNDQYNRYLFLGFGFLAISLVIYSKND